MKETARKNPDAMPFEEWLLRMLYEAYFEARKGKRRTGDEYIFEMNLMGNLMQLRDDIMEKNYKPSRGIAFISHRPVDREIFAAPFRDRVVHHFLYDQVADWWDKRLIYDSYSCRLNRGTLFGQKRVQKFMRKASQGGRRKAYVLKFDLQGYFMSLNRQKLFDRVAWGLGMQFPGADGKARRDLLEYVWSEIIFDDPIKGVRRRGSMSEWDNLPNNKSLFCQPPGQGIVIGNLSSQLLSNIYLDQLDRYMVYELGYKYYGRYVDDFVFVVAEEDFSRALGDVKKIEDFLALELGLTLHPRKRYIQEVSKGVEFLGGFVYPNRIIPGKRVVRNFSRAAQEVAYGKRDVESVVSYLGHLKHVNGYKIKKRIFDRYGWEY